MLHHLELWVADLQQSKASLGWLLQRLGCTVLDEWAHGVSYGRDGFYIVVESGPDVLPGRHQRCAAGMNHLALSVPTAEFNQVTEDALKHGFTLLFADRHPFAGGSEHRAAYLEDAAGFEVELVAQDPR